LAVLSRLTGADPNPSRRGLETVLTAFPRGFWRAWSTNFLPAFAVAALVLVRHRNATFAPPYDARHLPAMDGWASAL
jgi:hypothetical protein